MVCGNFILPEPASYVFFYAFSNLRNLLYIIQKFVLDLLLVTLRMMPSGKCLKLQRLYLDPVTKPSLVAKLTLVAVKSEVL